MTLSNAFGLSLSGFRRRAGISQSKLAARAGFDHSFLSRLESGDRAPSPQTKAEAIERLRARYEAEQSQLTMFDATAAPGEPARAEE